MRQIEKGFFDTPKVLQIEITNRCPFHCAGCYKEKRTGDMELELFKKIIDEAVELNVKQITLNGGEPMTAENLEAMIRYVDKRIPLATFTSGYMLDDKWVNLFLEHDVMLFISLNGSREEINAISREGYSEAITAMEKASQSKLPYYINWVARHENIADFPSLIDMAKQMRSVGINIVANKLDGNRCIQNPLTKEDYHSLIEIVQNDKDRFITIQRCYGVLIQEMGRRMTTFLDGCQAGISICAIMMDGSFQPCTHLSYTEKHDGILSYWNESPTLGILRERKTNSLTHCENCIKKNCCFFCRAMSTETHNNLLAGYKECPLFSSTSN